MNQGRIWCVVNPTVGLPLFLGGVTTIALIVHAAVMSHTSWMSHYWEGGSKAKVAQAAAPDRSGQPTAAPAGYAISVQPVTAQADTAATSFVVTVTPTVAAAQAPTSAKVADARTSP